jgi:hypothetical protein
VIKHVGDKWVLYTQDGSKTLGEHATEAEAQAQEAAIEASKHRAAEETDLRELHLLGATGQPRTEMMNGREHLVVPVVALMEGVIHAVNAETPEYVSLGVLQRAAKSWNGRPVVLGHPTKDGTQCSANSPDIEASHRIGTIYNSRVEGKKMLQEAWIDKAKAKQLHPAMYERLAEGKTEEVSVGAHVSTDKTSGEFGGKPYKAAWLETAGDHLAFLPGGRGACSVAMGCGTHRAAMHLVTAESIEVDDSLFEMFRAAIGKRNNATDQEMIQTVHDHATKLGAECQTQNVRFMSAIRGLEGKSLDERMQAVRRAVEKKYSNGNGLVAPSTDYAYPQTIYDDHVIVQKGDKLFSVDYVVKDGEVELTGEPVEVRQEYIAASAYKDCPTCDGTGQVNKDGKQMDCPSCEGEGEMKTAAAIVPQLKAACRCEGDTPMATLSKEKKAELIAALVTDKHSGFKQGDEPRLEAFEDARLEEFRAAADGRKADAEAKAKVETDNERNTARLKVAEEKLTALEAKVPTEDEFLASPAGATLRTLVAEKKAQDAEEREALVKTLKGVGANTEEELKAMDMGQLKTLAKYAKVPAPNFSGRGVPVPRDLAADKDEDYAPPNPWEAGIKSLQGKTVN